MVPLARPVAHPEHQASPVRTCVGCRKRSGTGELLRVVAVDGQLVVDEHRRLPGRGAWVHPEPDCLTKAERRRAFSRALKAGGALEAEGMRSHFKRLVEENTDEGWARVRKESRKQVDPS